MHGEANVLTNKTEGKLIIIVPKSYIVTESRHFFLFKNAMSSE